MHIDEIILDGFKSYSNKLTLGPFHPQFNAITGLNGSGKSNILDAICFVLGISNLQQVRVNRLDELVYKQGQAGITKASVSIRFNNQAKPSPLQAPYRDMKEIIVTRQIVIGGRNRYLLNSHNAKPKDIADLFHSVHLNVNNPHFLIMQGRITKVINMKPKELLGLIEEASGTRMYENKRGIAVKLIQKKEQKLEEINRIINEEIEPKLEKLRRERDDYQKWSMNNEEIERLERFDIAFRYHSAKLIVHDTNQSIDKLQLEKEGIEKETKKVEEQRQKLQLEQEKLQNDLAMKNEPLLELKHQKDVLEKELARLRADEKIKKKEVETEQAALVEAQKDAIKAEKCYQDSALASSDDTSALTKLKEQVEDLRNKLTHDEKRLQLLHTGGALGTDSGSLREQLKHARSRCSQLSSEIEISKDKKLHLQIQLKEAEKQIQSSEKDWADMVNERQQAEAHLQYLKNQLLQNDFKQSKYDALLHEKQKIVQQKESLRVKEVSASSDLSYYSINIRFPPEMSPQFYFGQLFELVYLKPNMEKYSNALQQLVGGSLSYVIVKNKETSTQLFRYNQFSKSRKKVTIWPMDDGVVGYYIKEQDLQHCRNLVGDESGTQVVSNYEIIEYESPKFDKLVYYVFGKGLICESAEIGRKIAYQQDKRKAWRVATTSGDIFNVGGSMSGGSSKNTNQIMMIYRNYKNIKDVIEKLKNDEKDLDCQISHMGESQKQYLGLTKQIKITEVSTRHLEEKLQSSKAGSDRQLCQSLQDQINSTEIEINLLEQQKQAELIAIENLNSELGNLENNRDSLQKTLKDDIRKLRANLKNAEQKVSETNKNLSDVQIQLETLKRQIEIANAEVEQRKSAIIAAEKVYLDAVKILDEKKKEVKVKDEQFKEKQESFSDSQNVSKNLQKQIEKCEKQLTHLVVDLKRLIHSIEDTHTDSAGAKQRVERLVESYPWLKGEEQNFNKAGSAYDFRNLRTETVRKKLAQLRQEQQQSACAINKKAVQMYDKTEQDYKELLHRKNKVEQDRYKIEEVISDLDQKKKESLANTWKQVNQYFMSIFSQLLPNSQAELQPVDLEEEIDAKAVDSNSSCNKDFIQGLQMRVGFNNKWKDSLAELSGGQRSLMALSLVLALLKCKPAPVYILDEIDAALDLSHTQNIGAMIKTQFPDSQFIIVSLKEGMFSHADVLFKTSFIEGVSSVERHSLERNSEETDRKRKRPESLDSSENRRFRKELKMQDQ